MLYISIEKKPVTTSNVEYQKVSFVFNRDVLKNNGTAADAAIAGMFCLGVVNPHSMGIGGGFLMTYYDRTSGQASSLIAREVAPAAAHKNMYGGNGELSTVGKRNFA